LRRPAISSCSPAGRRVGTIRQRAELPPKVQNWCRSALGWSMDLKGLAQNR
jgi:hypothetical protein